ncbi:MAG: hypothetical protein HZA90_08030 [Verrucomicrobia bacterium]|nr:hypothetical protein [Verrucomicrobiota bacterium]
MKATGFVLLVLFAVALGSSAATPALRVVKAANGTPLVRNGGFEELEDAQPAGWRAWQSGFRLAAGEGRGGSTAVVCENRSEKAEFGVSQTLTLNRARVAPLVVRAWSKAESAGAGADSGYSVYVDLVYADGSTLWGQTAPFRCGTHAWERREVLILPEKPVKSLTAYCLFRGHTGKVWFDDVTVEEVKAEGAAVLFQGVPVTPTAPSAQTPAAPEKRLETSDGLALTQRGGAIASVRAGPRDLTAPSPGGFLVRDVAANSDFFRFENGACPDLGLKVDVEFTSLKNHIAVRGRVTDTTAKDRAVTLVFALPLEAVGWRWGDDIRRHRVIAGRGEFANSVSVRCGATGTMSLYPLAAVWGERDGLALGLDMARPAVYRVGYHAGRKTLFIAWDFGLVKETERFPSGAEFAGVIYRFDPAAGFRSAFQKFTEIFPEHFAVRAKEQGLWMPFTNVSKVQGWEDFGFRFHEGNNNVPWDDEHGVLSFRYTEPMTWWMRMKKGTPRTMEAALNLQEELARGTDAQLRRMAEVSRVAAMFDEGGQPALRFQNTPWCDGAVWSLNPNPRLGVTAADASGPGAVASSRVPTNAATVYWSDSIKARLYGPAAKGRLDGEYLDSLEGYVTTELNFRREHFRASTVPLTFATDTKQPALFKGLAVAEFTKWMADDVRALGKLMFANGVPYRFTFLCSWLDVLGTETDWLRAGKYQPASLSQMDLWRTMSGAKPYLLLMNTDYDQFTPDLVEKYFNRCLFYGMWPGFFSHNAADNPYWQNPKWYNRDRPLFKKFLPDIKRVAEAGWQPVTGATCDNEKILLERFGPDAGGTVYFTAFNDTAQAQSGTVRAGAKPGQNWPVRLQPQECVVLRVAGGK